MAANYYFLAGLLPEVKVGMPVSLPFRELQHYLHANLSEDDYASVEVLRRYYDLENIRHLLRQEELIEYGNWTEADLEEMLLTGAGAPDYLFDYLERYDDADERLHHFPALIAHYYTNEIAKASGFLEEYLIFEREWRLVTAAFRAKEIGRDVGVELRYEDPFDEVVAQILAQRDSAHFEPPARYERLKGVFDQHKSEPLELHKAICEYRAERVAEMIMGDFFSLDKILGYIAQLMIAERWLELDQQAGMQVVDSIVKDVS